MKLVINKASGFSLIELIVFIAIVGFFSVATIRLLASTGDHYNESMIRAAIIQKTQSLIDKITLKNYTEISLSERETIQEGEEFNFSVNVTHAGSQFNLPATEVKYISVVAFYKNKQSFILSTYRFNH